MNYPAKRHVVFYAVVFLVAIVTAECLTFIGSGAPDYGFYLKESSSIAIVMKIIGDISIGAACVMLAQSAYKRYLWRHDPFLSIPILRNDYTGTIEFFRRSDSKKIRKHVDIRIVQSMDEIRMKLVSDSMTSTTLVGRFVEENKEPVLYYVYSIASRIDGFESGSRRGAARLELNMNGCLEGEFWTDEKSRGRIYFADLPLDSNELHPAEEKVTKQNECSINTIYLKLESLLQSIAKQAGDDFSGVGLLIHDANMDQGRIVSLRGGAHLASSINIFSEKGREYLLEISKKSHDGHDGFCLVNQTGRLEKVSQYLIFEYPPSVAPDFNRGARSYSALCGSLLEGVLAVGIVSENKSYAIYASGECILDSIIQL